MVNKTIKAVVSACVLIVSGSILAANDYVYKIASSLEDEANIELVTTTGYSMKASLSLGTVITWYVPKQKGCLNSIKVNGQPIRDAAGTGKSVWAGTVCADNAVINILPGNPFSNNIPMVSISNQ